MSKVLSSTQSHTIRNYQQLKKQENYNKDKNYKMIMIYFYPKTIKSITRRIKIDHHPPSKQHLWIKIPETVSIISTNQNSNSSYKCPLKDHKVHTIKKAKWTLKYLKAIMMCSTINVDQDHPSHLDSSKEKEDLSMILSTVKTKKDNL